MRTDSEEAKAAVTVQKFYRSHRIRRRLADSAFVGDLWWQAQEYALLNCSTISHFNYLKPEPACKRMQRVLLNASRVGKGLSDERKARKLAFQHWIEAIDPRHRYGHNLHLYHEVWRKGNSAQPFFYWLDVGHGRAVDLEECSRSKLQEQRIKYLGPKEREHHEYVVNNGKIWHKKNQLPMDTTKGSEPEKWIYVMDTTRKLYAAQKKKGTFHHSSFLAGGSTLAAGSITAVDGVLKSISAYSGHYRPTTENLKTLLDFLTENGINLDEVEVTNSPNENDMDENHDSDLQANVITGAEVPEPIHYEASNELEEETNNSTSHKKTLYGGLPSPKAYVPRDAVIQRSNSKKAINSYQLGRQLARKWSSGAGPRIGCLADYPAQLREEALEFLKLSPRSPIIL